MNGEDQLDDRVGNEEELQRVREEKGIQSAIQRRKTKWTGHVLRRNCHLSVWLKEI